MKIILLLLTVLWFPAAFCLYFMQARVDWVLTILGTQVIKKKRPVRSVFPDYHSVSYDHDNTNRRFTSHSLSNTKKKRKDS